MPVHKVKLPGGGTGYRFGTSGKVYKKREDAQRQQRAIFASGWREHGKRASDGAQYCNSSTYNIRNKYMSSFETIYKACMSKVAAEVDPTVYKYPSYWDYIRRIGTSTDFDTRAGIGIHRGFDTPKGAGAYERFVNSFGNAYKPGEVPRGFVPEKQDVRTRRESLVGEPITQRRAQLASVDQADEAVKRLGIEEGTAAYRDAMDYLGGGAKIKRESFAEPASKELKNELQKSLKAPFPYKDSIPDPKVQEALKWQLQYMGNNRRSPSFNYGTQQPKLKYS